MKYKAGDKFVIEIDRIEGNLYGIKGFNTTVFDDNGLDRLESVEEALNKARQEGAEDAWELASKMVFLPRYGGYPLDMLAEVFGNDDADIIMKDNSYSEAKAKIKEYERKKKEEEEKIRVGDVVEYPNPFGSNANKYYVTLVRDSVFYGIRTSDGATFGGSLKGAKKTGKHKDLEEVLKGLRE